MISEYLEGGAAALATGELTWIQHYLGNRTDMVACALGACNYAECGNMWVTNAAGQDMPGQLRRDIVEYNNAPGRTVDEVIDYLTNLAKEYRNEGQ